MLNQPKELPKHYCLLCTKVIDENSGNWEFCPTCEDSLDGKKGNNHSTKDLKAIFEQLPTLTIEEKTKLEEKRKLEEEQSIERDKKKESKKQGLFSYGAR